MPYPELPRIGEKQKKEKLNTIEIKRWKYLFLNIWFIATFFILTSSIFIAVYFAIPLYTNTLKPLLDIYSQNSTIIKQSIIEWTQGLK